MNPFQRLWSIFSAMCLSILFTFSLHGQQSDGGFSFRFADIPAQESVEDLSKGALETSHVLVQWVSDAQIEGFPKDKAYYLGNRSYIISSKLWATLSSAAKSQVQAWAPYDEKYKVHPDLLENPLAVSHLEVVLDKSVSYQTWVSTFKNQALPVEKYLPGSHFIVVENTPGRIERLQSMPEVIFIYSGGRWSEPEDLRSKRLHNSLQLDAPHGVDLGYDGTGVSVQVRDDGMVGPHLDMKGRLINDPSLPFDTVGTHAEGVAGVLAGAGNIDGEARGMAPGARVFVTGYEPSFLDNTLNLHIEENVLYTNSSYSNGCNEGYTPNAAEVDRQIYTYPTYLHIFSAGNSNNRNCGYGAGNQWGNVTGGHKQAKNAIATANVDPQGLIMGSSSRGPATDGRLKPDIAANGARNYSLRPNNRYAAFGGTSGAAPCVAGVAAQLNHAFVDQFGADAPSALIKAALLNGAREAGQPGPDFIYGFGLLDAYNAYKILSGEQFLSGSINQAENREFIIDIPQGVNRVKVLLYWADPPAAPMAQKALVNDLDIEVEHNGESYLPLVLDPTPVEENLARPAEPGIDRLNNVEQVVFNAENPGQVTVKVEGWNINEGPQDFHLVYFFEQLKPEPAFQWISPQPFRYLELSNSLRVEWDSDATTNQNRRISYSLDGGSSWTEKNIVLPFDYALINLSEPAPQNGDSLIVAYADANLTDTLWNPIYYADPHLPDEVRVESYCIDSAVISWKSKPNAQSYQLYALGEKFMDRQMNTTDTFATIPISIPVDHNLFAMRTNYGNGIWSERQIATNYSGGLLDCPQENELALANISATNQIQGFTCSPFELEFELEIDNNGLKRVDSFQICYQLDGLSPVCEWVIDTLSAQATQAYTFDSLPWIDRDYDQLQAWVSLAEDRFLWNDTLQQDFPIRFLSESDIQPTMNLSFLGDSLPVGTQVVTSDEEQTWRIFEATDRRQDNAGMLVMPNYFYEDVGAVDAFFSPVIRLDSSWTEAELLFEYAYSAFNLAPDSLFVLALNPCDLTVIDSLWINGGENMATANAGFDAFEPSSFRDWATARIPLGHLVGQEMIISFTSLNGYGNNLWLNRPAIIENDSYIHDVTIEVDPERICPDSTAQLSAQIDGPHVYLAEWLVPNQDDKLSGPVINYLLNGEGAHTVVSLVSNDFFTRITEDTLQPIQGVLLDVDWDRTGNTVQFTAQTTGADSILWTSNRGFQFVGNNLTYIGTPGEGLVLITVTAFGECGPVSETIEIEFTVSAEDPAQLSQNPTLYPNPSKSGAVYVEGLSTEMARQMRGIRWLNGAGLLMHDTESLSAAENGVLRISWPPSLGPAYYILDLYDQQGQSLMRWKVIRQ
jgi:hypothetical protein